jgi:hypothetical protein
MRSVLHNALVGAAALALGGCATTDSPRDSSAQRLSEEYNVSPGEANDVYA